MFRLLRYGESAMAEIRARGAAQAVRQEHASGVLHHERPLYYELRSSHDGGLTNAGHLLATSRSVRNLRLRRSGPLGLLAHC